MSYRKIWEVEVYHAGLNKYRHIRGSDRYTVEQKALIQKIAWEDAWEKRLVTEQKRMERESYNRNKEERKELARSKTLEAQRDIEQLQTLLETSLYEDNSFEGQRRKSMAELDKRKPRTPRYVPLPAEPCIEGSDFKPRFNVWDYLFPVLKRRKIQIAGERFLSAHASWEAKKHEAAAKNLVLKQQYLKETEVWGKAKSIQEKKYKQYLAGLEGATIDYFEQVLSGSSYPEYFPREWELDYDRSSKTLIVDYRLPTVDSFPVIKEFRYISSRDEVVESRLSDSFISKLYDKALYQVALRTINEIYESDAALSTDSTVFNGWVNSIDKATGRDLNACIMSLHVSRDDFLDINLSKVDSRACFISLKGVASSRLHGLTPIAPIVSVDRSKEDKRFVSPYEVAGRLDEESNLAAMDWQDFENLIREVFEKEFLASGGEVKITQASRDGGVDAIAFDPDPIRGGKIVIQAKRYTNVVSVSAVRDLYGTVMNEGATKGILVTTADYGPDAYNFAKGKPLTLLNGGNLLHLLQKHGHRARIDIKEARVLMKR